ncbi:His Kinase A (phospho-acceptor) domain-containing protein [Maribacter sedimenticola]|uniref:histidine kinase n=1 Tax=Maribacter sedimenticola TaxID=228956 RepID=A0ABY1SFH5_9FLAO|nr:sensor histidine kinase [Maribacter sedimenticola]SNR41993.1 His Kinase A (phospho-acceptor) domain-containing protein [Maribacter sedimenticola]
MKHILYIIGFLLSLTVFSQQEKVLTISDTTLVNRWAYLESNWSYKKGDNINWSDPKFDDSSWTKISSKNLNKPNNKIIGGDNEIVWFRKLIKTDSTFNNPIVLNVYQAGASEIYLDGKLIRTLGKVSSNPEEIETIFSWKIVFHLPLEKNKAHLLAVRFVNSQRKYPKYFMNDGHIYIQATSIHNILTTDPRLVTPIKETRNYYNNLYIVLGIVLFMFVLFLFLYIFFKREKINGYFALTSLLYSCFLGAILLEYKTNFYEFKYDFIIGILNVLYPLAALYCIYKIFNKRIGYFYWGITAIGILLILSGFLVSSVYTGHIFGVIILVEFLRISSLSYKSDKIGALIFLLTGVLNLIFWIIATLHQLGYFDLPQLIYYVPFAYILLPLSIAIYLGYFFGNRSQSLRLNLERVQKLSKEKESILSEQKDTLEQQVKERTSELNQSLDDLKATQSQLIQSEKMASLGELTAGIAHEIQNPLNFVNNFSEVSNELIDEMNEELDKGDLEEVKAISLDIKQNLEKINHHGKRADNIVKGMLQHSRSSSGTKEPTDINTLADEYLRLAYHGLRAKDKSFNAELITNFDESIGKVNIVPQDMGRVILNLITNAFYAVNEKKQRDVSFKPIVTVSTKKSDEYITISVSDNGDGIPEKVKEKIFQPFFTTKPTGQGTGLGLSMSYDIVTKGHDGKLKVETTKNKGTAFFIELPN